MSEKKTVLRKLYKEKTSLIQNREQLSAKIAERIFALDEYKSCDCVFAYFSVFSEVSTVSIIKRARKDDKAVALPQCEKEGNAMHFFLTEKESELENGRFNGIFEPKKGLLKAQATKKTLILVPALAYGRNGSRLGKGMGFYDRFLAESKGVPVGLCFEENLADALPETGLDRRVRIIITENETLFIN